MTWSADEAVQLSLDRWTAEMCSVKYDHFIVAYSSVSPPSCRLCFSHQHWRLPVSIELLLLAQCKPCIATVGNFRVQERRFEIGCSLRCQQCFPGMSPILIDPYFNQVMFYLSLVKRCVMVMCLIWFHLVPLSLTFFTSAVTLFCQSLNFHKVRMATLQRSVRFRIPFQRCLEWQQNPFITVALLSFLMSDKPHMICDIPFSYHLRQVCVDMFKTC